jgi:hypothetical protein
VNVFRSKSLLVVCGGMVAIAVIIYLLAFEWQQLRSKTCAGLTAIASDAQKMKYVEAWIYSRTTDHKFMNELRRNRFFAPGDGRMQEYVDLDWTYLGLNPKLVSLAFNVKNAGARDFAATQIGSVSIGQGRSMILIRLNDSRDFGLLWPVEDLSRIEPIADQVFVYCGT